MKDNIIDRIRAAWILLGGLWYIFRHPNEPLPQVVRGDAAVAGQLHEQRIWEEGLNQYRTGKLDREAPSSSGGVERPRNPTSSG